MNKDLLWDQIPPQLPRLPRLFLTDHPRGAAIWRSQFYTEPAKGIYRLLTAGELLEARDQVYSPSQDVWFRIHPFQVGTAYDPSIGPVRRFNK